MKKMILSAVALLLSASACAAPFKVMTFNIRYDNPADGVNAWPARRAAVVTMLKAEKPDVLGIQEGLAHQVAFLDSALRADYAYVGVGRDDGKEAGEFAALFYNKNRFELLESGNFWLSETPETPSIGWDAACIRIVTWAKLRDRQSGREFVALNTHFDHVGTEARAQSAILLVSRALQLSGAPALDLPSVAGRQFTQRAAGSSNTIMEALPAKQQGLPVVITGDFNSTLSNPVLRTLLYVFREARTAPWPTSSLPGYTFNGFRTGAAVPKDGVIDLVFYRYFMPLNYNVITDGYGVPFLSDHYPVEATFDFPAEE